MKKTHRENYLDLLRRFTQNTVSADEFEKDFLALHRTDSNIYDDETHKILSILFSDVDTYCSDPRLRTKDDIDANELLESAKVALRGLDQSSSNSTN
jgi:hypothetical protein